MNQYDEIKSLLKISRMLVEQSAPVNIDADIEQDINVETSPEDKTKTYRVSGGLIKLHGKINKIWNLALMKKPHSKTLWMSL